MRLIDADLINFEEVFGGKSDFAKDMREAAQGLIDRQPTVFDKEKVIEELKKHADIAIETNDAYGSEVALGEWDAYKQAERIVEKGGIE